MNERQGLLRRVGTALCVAALVAGGTAGLTASAASAEVVDTTPPVFTKPLTTSLPLGAVLTTTPGRPGDCQDSAWSSIRVAVDMRAKDQQSGVTGYTVIGSFVEDEFRSGRWVDYAQEGDHSCGGGSSNLAFSAVNGAGLRTAWVDWQATRLGVVDDADPLTTYRGGWSVSTCSCWSEGTTRRTTEPGASAAVTVPAGFVGPTGRRITDGAYSLGLVMAKGPDRGMAEVYVDGTRVATVDTWSATPVNRTVVWRQPVTAGSHTVEVVNLGTPGRPRIDLDAVLMLKKG